MYVVGFAKKQLKVGTPTGTDIRYPGDAVPEAALWAENVLQSNLNMNHIQTEDQYLAWKKSAEIRDEMTKKARARDKEKALEQQRSAEIAKENQARLDAKEGHTEGAGESGTITDHVAEAKPVEDGNEPQESGKPVEKMSMKELKVLAESMSLAIRGNKKQVRDRILAAQE